MAKLLRGNEVSDYSFVVLDKETDLSVNQGSETELIIPVKLWLEEPGKYQNMRNITGLYFEPDDEPEAVGEHLSRFPLVLIGFPKFVDGRGYSICRILREYFDYPGDIRAKGDVLIDQLAYMTRCGFSSFLVREDQDHSSALKALGGFDCFYQECSDGAIPVSRKRHQLLAS